MATTTTTEPQALANQTFGSGTLIIPMDTANQDNGTLRAFGLIYRLLQNGVPVQWAIKSGKADQGADFTIAGNLLNPRVKNHETNIGLAFGATYRGGPFLVAPANRAAALPIVDAWLASDNSTVVHELTASGSITVDIARTLTAAPKIAVFKDGFEQIAFGDLNAAGIPDSAGKVWSQTSIDLLTEAQVAGTAAAGDGALFQAGVPRYCQLTSMHYDATATTPEVVKEVRAWLASSPATHAFMECQATETFENDANGHFLSTGGITDDGNAPGNLTNRFPEDPLTQYDGNFNADFGAVDSLGLAAGSTLKANARVLFNSGATPAARMVWLSGFLDGDTTKGKVTYLAGHDYSTNTPISNNSATNGVRLILDSIFESPCVLPEGQPKIELAKSAPATINGNTLTFTITYTNTGGGPANNVSISDMVPATTTFQSATAGGTLTGNTVKWTIGLVGAGATGSVSFTVTVAADGTITNTATGAYQAGTTNRTATSNTTSTIRDSSTPDTTIVSGPPALSASTSAMFDFSSNAANVTYECKLDAGTFVPCTDPVTFSSITGGLHHLEVRAKTAGGVVDPSPATYDWRVDSTSPTTSNDTASTMEDMAVSIAVLGNDANLADGPIATSIAMQPAHGTAVAQPDGTILYTPAQDFNGTDTFTYTATDGDGDTSTATVTVTVTPVNDAPVAIADNLSAGQAPASLFVLDNDRDVDGDTLAIQSVTQPSSGTTAIDAATGTITYTPAAGFIGTVEFDYTITDGHGLTSTAHVTLEIQMDADSDGLPDSVETAIGTDPHDADSDDDGVIDGREHSPGADTDHDGLINALDPDSDNDGIYDGTEQGVVTPPSATNLHAHHFIADADPATHTDPLDADTDDGSIEDGAEDTNRNGKVDAGERDPNNAADDVPTADIDGDGLPDAVETVIGTDPNDADSDDDGVPDGLEPNYQDDTDGDGLINANDPDSDNDGLFDGTEAGVTTAPAGTDPGKHHFIPDDDSSTTTGILTADTDKGGVEDGAEDTDHDGRVDAGERDPNNKADDTNGQHPDMDGDGLPDDVETKIGTDPADADSDDDGVPDGSEPNYQDDTDGDGLINALDFDSDGDGLYDGTEMGVTTAPPGTDETKGHFRADADPTTTTSPLDPDTDHGGVRDGDEDSNHDGKVDTNERDPNDPSDDSNVTPPKPDTDNDGILDDGDNCPMIANADQADLDDDNIGDACDPDKNGDGFADNVGVQGGGCSTSGGSSGGLVMIGIALAAGLARRRRAIVIGTTILGSVGSVAHADEPRNFTVERFELSTDREGVMDVEWAEARGDMKVDVGIYGSYVDDPLVLTADGTRTDGGELVSQRVGASLVGSVSPKKWLSIGAELPLILTQDRGEMSSSVAPMGLSSMSSFGTGNLRLAPKLTLLDHRASGRGVSVALVPALILPTASAGNAYFGDHGVAFAPELVISRAFASGARITGEIGYRARKRAELLNLVVDDEVFARLGAGYRFAGTPLELDLTMSTATRAAHPFDDYNTDAFEGFGGASYKVVPAAVMFAGAGIGLRNGFGTPDWRALIGVRFGSSDEPAKISEPVRLEPPAPLDSDGDGILDTADTCAHVAEDKDGFEDTDGCPELDNDKDGIADGDDACRDLAGIAALKGCPDGDGDGIADASDKCPTQAEDVDGFQDDDGCPELDNDGDGVVDTADKCPIEAGVIVNLGCPDKDRDNDTVVDRLDNCPDEPGDPKNQGCKAKQLVTITEGKLVILDSVYFQTNKATILSKSFKLLDNVASVISSHPALMIQVEGHTDSVGDDGYNRSLSQSRAEAVVAYLVKKGVDATHLVAVGFGEDQPIESNKTEAGRSKNRRVVFTIKGDDTVQTRP